MDNVDYDLILDKEFDALNLESKVEAYEEILKSKQYPAKAHARKIADELSQVDEFTHTNNGIIYLPGEPTRLYEDSDQGPTFRQRRYFYYITGVDFPDCAVTYEIGQDKLTLWIPFVEPRQVLWFGSTPNAAKAMQLYDVDDVRYINDLPKFFNTHINPKTTLYVLHEKQTPQYLHEDSMASYWPGQKKPGHVNHSLLKPAMDRARVIKDEYEIALIRKANNISSVAHRDVARQLLRLQSERQIEAIIRATCTARGGRSQAYAIIAGAGINASTLHYDANDQPLEGKQLVVIDAGCEYNCYASDITRTLPLSGSFTKEGQAIHDIVQRMQDECIEAVKPGGKFVNLHIHAAKVAAEGLLKLGILKGELKDVEESGVASAFFPHGLGHHVGLDVHDVSGDKRLLSAERLVRLEGGKREMIMPSDLAHLRRVQRWATDPVVRMYSGDRQTLQAGMVVTVEPGIYFCREYIEGYFLSRSEFARYIDEKVLEGYYDVGGVRIEDDILVTEDGYDNLTKAPKGEELLEIINGDFQLVE